MSELRLQWEESACDWCGSQRTQLVFEGPDRFLHLPGTFHLVRCSGCGLMRQNPRLVWDSLQNYYPREFISYGTIIANEPNPLMRWSRRYGMWKKLRILRQLSSGGRLLDVGCGTGIFLGEAARDSRWQVMGIEPTEYAANYARKALGIEILQSTLSQVSLPKDSFDIITMWDVIEHIPNPIADLRVAYSLLRKGGWLVLQIPNVESQGASVFGRYWVGWDLPRHLYFFPRMTLAVILESIGLRPVMWRCLSASYFTLAESLKFWSQSWSAQHLHYADVMLKIYASLFVRGALLAPLWVLDRLNRSTLLTVFAQKV